MADASATNPPRVRNSVEIGENLMKIVKRLLANQNLLKLLYYEDEDPFSKPDLSEEKIRKEVFEKLVKIVPRVGPKDTAKSLISLRVVSGDKNPGNGEFRDIEIAIEVFVPLSQWILKGTNLRPFAILGEIENSLDGKLVNGLGRISGGDFAINFLTDEISCYEQTFSITQYA